MTMQMLEAIGPEIIATFLVGFVFAGFIYLINFLLEIIGSYKMFRKAGEAGWKAIIPFLDDYTRFDLFWNKNLFWAYLVIMVGSFTLGMGGSGIGAFLSTLCSIALIILTIKLYYETARSFGKGVGMTILLTLLPGIGYMILGFGKAQYQGQKKISDAEL